MTGKFYIVKFPDEKDAVEVIPKLWVVDLSCYWPPSCKPSAFKKLVKKCQAPDENIWTLHNIKIIKEFETYEEARLKLKEATFTSDLDSQERPGKKIVRRKSVPLPKYPKKINDPSDDSQSSKQDEVQPATLDNSFYSSASDAESNEGEIVCNQNVEPISFEIVNAPETTAVGTQTSISMPNLDFQVQVTLALKLIKATLHQHGEILDSILSHTVAAKSEEPELQSSIVELLGKYKFPVSSAESISELNTSIEKSSDTRQQLYTFLKGCGGTDTRDSCKRILEKLMVDELAGSHSLKGARGKRNFSTYTNIVCVIKDVLKITDSAVEQGITGALKLASDRVRNRQKGNGSSSSSEIRQAP